MADQINQREYKGPVAWLGGRDLLANLKYFALFAAYKGKLDPRDWMNAEIYPSESLIAQAMLPPKEAADQAHNPVAAFWRVTDSAGEFWFDYFADSGDGMTAGYSIAYLCLSDLRVAGPQDWTQWSAEQRKQIIEQGEMLADLKALLETGSVRNKIKKWLARYKATKPSGALLKDEAETDEVTARTRTKIQKFLAKHAVPQSIRELLQGEYKKGAVIERINREAGFIELEKPGTKADVQGTILPRGAFLFVGGDTTYHVADYASLGERFQTPFKWAAKDMIDRWGLPPDAFKGENRRPIFGIPGNHDYYDEIDGFNRQFAEPLTKEDDFIDLHGRNLPPLLSIPGFKRCQRASYIAIRLPFDWWLWGVDSELERLDMRQQEYFKNACLGSTSPVRHDQHRPLPEKLIIATSEPTTVSGQRSAVNDKTAQAFADLNLKRPFLFRDLTEKLSPEEQQALDKCKAADKELQEFQCRLDISGDTHHYARYWGAENSNGRTGPDNYASVVSGGGGASLSPTQTVLGDIKTQALYPPKEKSRHCINRQLFNFYRVFKGGNVYLAGIIIALILYLGASLPAVHAHVTNALLYKGIDFLNRLPGKPITFQHVVDTDLSALALLLHPLKLVLFLLLAALAVGGSALYANYLFIRLTKSYDWVFNNSTNPAPETDREPFKKLVDEIVKQKPTGIAVKSRVPFWLISICGFALLVFYTFAGLYYRHHVQDRARNLYLALSLILGLIYIIVTCWFSAHLSEQRLQKEVIGNEHKTELEKLAEIRQLVVTPYQDYVPFWMLLLFGVLVLTGTLLEFRAVPAQTQFGTSLCLLFALLVSVSATLGSLYYSRWLIKQSYRISVTSFSYWPVRALSALAAGCLVASGWIFGYVATRYLFLNLIFISVVTAVVVGCWALACFVGNKVKQRRYQLGFSVLGLWHAVLQLSMPFLMIWLGSWYSWVLAVLLILVMTAARNIWARLTAYRFVLPLVWFVYGLVLLALPIICHKEQINPTVALPFVTHVSPFWQKFWSAILAGGFGALMSCVWLGWYFAVSLVFNGHSNEAGSTALIENYKQFIRFRLTRDTLTGYVIGVDEVQPRGSKLQPRIVDIIHLRCRP